MNEDVTYEIVAYKSDKGVWTCQLCKGGTDTLEIDWVISQTNVLKDRIKAQKEKGVYTEVSWDPRNVAVGECIEALSKDYPEYTHVRMNAYYITDVGF